MGGPWSWSGPPLGPDTDSWESKGLTPSRLGRAALGRQWTAWHRSSAAKQVRANETESKFFIFNTLYCSYIIVVSFGSYFYCLGKIKLYITLTYSYMTGYKFLLFGESL